MLESITVSLPSELKKELDEFSCHEHRPADEVMSEALREHFFIKKFRLLREKMVAKAKAQGITSDEDVFSRIS